MALRSSAQKQRAPEDDLDDLRKKCKMLEGDRKIFFDATSMAKQKNREQIMLLQKENKELREMMKSRVRKSLLIFQALLTSGASSSSTRLSDMSNKAEKDLAVWTRKLDDMKKKTFDKKEHLLALQDK